MSRLTLKVPETDQELADWQRVHNTVIPTHRLSLDDVRDRVERHHILIAYLDDEAVGSTTVRPPSEDSLAVTVIARVLPEHRRQGFGTELYERALARASELDPPEIETVVLSSNEDGLRFAEQHGFVEFDRYTLPGEAVPWVDLRLARVTRTG
jgi:GNAT superfamily N-acetyltransferase